MLPLRPAQGLPHGLRPTGRPHPALGEDDHLQLVRLGTLRDRPLAHPQRWPELQQQDLHPVRAAQLLPEGRQQRDRPEPARQVGDRILQRLGVVGHRGPLRRVHPPVPLVYDHHDDHDHDDHNYHDHNRHRSRGPGRAAGNHRDPDAERARRGGHRIPGRQALAVWALRLPVSVQRLRVPVPEQGEPARRKPVHRRGRSLRRRRAAREPEALLDVRGPRPRLPQRQRQRRRRALLQPDRGLDLAQGHLRRLLPLPQREQSERVPVPGPLHGARRAVQAGDRGVDPGRARAGRRRAAAGPAALRGRAEPPAPGVPEPQRLEPAAVHQAGAAHRQRARRPRKPVLELRRQRRRANVLLLGNERAAAGPLRAPGVPARPEERRVLHRRPRHAHAVRDRRGRTDAERVGQPVPHLPAGGPVEPGRVHVCGAARGRGRGLQADVRRRVPRRVLRQQRRLSAAVGLHHHEQRDGADERLSKAGAHGPAERLAGGTAAPGVHAAHGKPGPALAVLLGAEVLHSRAKPGVGAPDLPKHAEVPVGRHLVRRQRGGPDGQLVLESVE
mmetsp:Transcript_20128/g.50803  ORF Transcript_20128/g.50803 Transcript_20128/m.50803 type:complete len:557 (-) Transcript_20128:685-2355(-)